MNERNNNLSEIFRRAMDTNLKFYSGLVELSVDYLKNVGELISELPGQVNPGKPAAQPGSAPSIVLEAGAGELARAPMLVENHLSREVTAAVSFSAFTDTEGNEASINVSAEPAQMTLPPGEKILVHILASIDENLTIDTSYRGSITVPELSENSIPIIIRRLNR